MPGARSAQKTILRRDVGRPTSTSSSRQRERADAPRQHDLMSGLRPTKLVYLAEVNRIDLNSKNAIFVGTAHTRVIGVLDHRIEVLIEVFTEVLAQPCIFC
jgi:hypothetical protein